MWSAQGREEAIRAYWMICMLESTSTLGLTESPAILRVPAFAVLPCPQSSWASHGTSTVNSSNPPEPYSSTFSLCIMLALEELGAIHRFINSPYNLESLDQRQTWQTEAQKLDERLTDWREEFVAAVFRLINSEKDHLPLGEMEPFITLTNCILNM